MKEQRTAFTLIELLVVIASWLLPALSQVEHFATTHSSQGAAVITSR